MIQNSLDDLVYFCWERGDLNVTLAFAVRMVQAKVRQNKSKTVSNKKNNVTTKIPQQFLDNRKKRNLEHGIIYE